MSLVQRYCRKGSIEHQDTMRPATRSFELWRKLNHIYTTSDGSPCRYGNKLERAKPAIQDHIKHRNGRQLKKNFFLPRFGSLRKSKLYPKHCSEMQSCILQKFLSWVGNTYVVNLIQVRVMRCLSFRRGGGGGDA